MRSKISILKTNLGSNQLWTALWMILLLIGCFWPTLECVYWHAGNARVQHSGPVTVTVPLLWTYVRGGSYCDSCTNGLFLIKSAPTIFGAGDAGSTLRFVVVASAAADKSQSRQMERAFRAANAEIIPFRMAAAAERCLKGRAQRREGDVNVLCDLRDHSFLVCSGSDSALTQAASMLH